MYAKQKLYLIPLIACTLLLFMPFSVSATESSDAAPVGTQSEAFTQEDSSENSVSDDPEDSVIDEGSGEDGLSNDDESSTGDLVINGADSAVQDTDDRSEDDEESDTDRNLENGLPGESGSEPTEDEPADTNPQEDPEEWQMYDGLVEPQDLEVIETFFEKDFEDYTVTEGLLLLIFVCVFCSFCIDMTAKVMNWRMY